MFRVNNKDIRTTLMICSSVFIVNYEHILLLFFDDSFVDLEQINVLWVRDVLHVLTLPVPCISKSCIEIKIKLNFIFTLLCGASKGFMKAFKAPQRSVKIKI